MAGRGYGGAHVHRKIQECACAFLHMIVARIGQQEVGASTWVRRCHLHLRIHGAFEGIECLSCGCHGREFSYRVRGCSVDIKTQDACIYRDGPRFAYVYLLLGEIGAKTRHAKKAVERLLN